VIGQNPFHVLVLKVVLVPIIIGKLLLVKVILLSLEHNSYKTTKEVSFKYTLMTGLIRISVEHPQQDHGVLMQVAMGEMQK
jgi:prolipoprotein diacylglyceryltransferase